MAPGKLVNSSLRIQHPLITDLVVDVTSASWTAAEGIAVDLSMSGSVTSPFLDTISGTQGVIDNVSVRSSTMRDETTSMQVPITTTTKAPAIQRDPGLPMHLPKHPYPYIGTLTTAVVEDLRVGEGTVVINVSAQDKINGLPGFVDVATHIQFVEREQNETKISSATLSLDIPVTGISSSFADTFPVTYSLNGGASITLSLTETGNDTLEFVDSAAEFFLDLSDSASDVTLGARFRIEGTGLGTTEGRDLGFVLSKSGSSYSGALTTVSFTSSLPTPPAGVVERYLQVSDPVIVRKTTAKDFHPGRWEIRLPLAWDAAEVGEKLRIEDTTTGTEVVAFAVETGQTLVSVKPGTEEDDIPEPVYITDRGTTGQALANLVIPTANDEWFKKKLAALKIHTAPVESQYATGLAFGWMASGKNLVVGAAQLASSPIKFITYGVAVQISRLQLKILGENSQFSFAAKATLRKYEGAVENNLLNKLIEGVTKALVNSADVDVDLALLAKQLQTFSGDLVDGGTELIDWFSENAGVFLTQVEENWNESQPKFKGYHVGRAAFEIMTVGVAYAKAGRLPELSKSKLWQILDDKAVFLKQNSVLSSLAAIKSDWLSTKMCFVPGTLVHTERGLVSIEELHIGDMVFAREEDSVQGTQGLRSITEKFETHPTELVEISIDRSGDLVADDVIIATPEHPIWINEERKFIRAISLQKNQSVSLVNAGSARIVDVKSCHAEPGKRFTTYNFEVEEFHTYFVGKFGIWVHNTGRAPCEIIFSTFVDTARKLSLTGNALKAKRFEILVETRTTLKKGIPRRAARVWGRSAADVSQKMLDDYAAGLIQHADLPSVKDWRSLFFRRNTPGAEVDVHHAVEEYIQEFMGINIDGIMNGKRIGDACPGIPLPRNKEKLDMMNLGKSTQHQLKAIHKGKANGGVSGILQSEIPTGNPGGLSPQAVITKLNQVYTDPARPEFHNMWPASRDWLIQLQSAGHLDPSLSIP